MVGALALLLVVARSNKTDIFAAVRKDSPELIQRAIDEGEDVNAVGYGRQSPLLHAAIHDKQEALRFLVQAGADTSTADRDGRTILHGAAERGNSAVVQLLLDLGLDPNDRHSDGLTPIHRACLGREPEHTETVRVLLKAGVPAEQKTADGKKPIFVTQNVETLELLREKVLEEMQAREHARRLVRMNLFKEEPPPQLEAPDGAVPPPPPPPPPETPEEELARVAAERAAEIEKLRTRLDTATRKLDEHTKLWQAQVRKKQEELDAATAREARTAQQLWACNQAHDGSRAFDAASAPLELPPAGTCADAADAEAHCGAWAGAGECARNAAFMRLKCRRSCGMCTV